MYRCMRKLLSCLLILTMCLGLLPLGVLADGEDAPVISEIADAEASVEAEETAEVVTNEGTEATAESEATTESEVPEESEVLAESEQPSEAETAVDTDAPAETEESTGADETAAAEASAKADEPTETEESIKEEPVVEAVEPAESEEELAADGDGDAPEVTRAQWISALVETFSMTVEEDNYPDNYYTDISDEDDFYRDIMVAVEFGVIDLEYGQPFRPNDAATQQFAASTLVFCLGFVPMDENATMDETFVSQLAVERGWFTTYAADMALTAAQKTSMLTDAAEVLAGEAIDENHENTSQFADGVVVFPMGTEIEVENDQDTVHIYNTEVTLKTGDIFIIYYADLPMAAKALSVSIQDGVYVVDYTTDGTENVILEIDYAGHLPADPDSFVPADGRSYINEEGLLVEESTSEYEPITDGLQIDKAITLTEDFPVLDGKSVSIGSISESRSVPLSKGITASISASLTNMYLDYQVKKTARGGVESATVKINGDTQLRTTVKGSLNDATGSGSVTLGTVRFMGTAGKATLSFEYGLSGEIALTWAGRLVTGFEYKNSSFRIIAKYNRSSFTVTAEANIKAGLKAEVGVELLSVIKASIWATVGAQGKLTAARYDSGSPTTCIDFCAWLYANVGVKAKLIFVNEWKKEIPILDKNSNGNRTHYHWEDGKQVSSCTRGKDFSNKTGSAPGNFYTDPGSRYFNPGLSDATSTFTDSAGNTIQMWSYELDDDGNAIITGFNGSASAIRVPKTIDGYKVVAIGKEAFKNNKNLGSVIVSDGVTTIGNSAFNGCTYLAVIDLPDSLVEIGPSAFRNCTSLTAAILPEGLTTIGGHMFRDCTSLQKVYIPKTIKGITSGGESSFGSGYYYSPFANCSALDEVEFGEGITSICLFLFEACTGLTHIEIPDTVTTIYGSAFKDCTNLVAVKLGQNLESIKTSAFSNCPLLKEIVIPDTVTDMGEAVFQDCASMTSVKLPATRINITKNMFNGCASLTKIELPETVEYIREGAFQDCTALKEIVWSKAPKLIEKSAFANTGFTDFTVPDTVTSLGDSAFKGCTELKTVTISDSVTSIGSSAFYDCDALTALAVPDSVTSIGKSLCYDCDALSDVSLGTGITAIPESAFEHCDALASIVLPYRTASIGQKAFKDCVKLTEVSIPRKTETIPTNAFSYYDKLTIYGISGTYAETYANTNSIKFVNREVKAESVTLSAETLTVNNGQTDKLILTVEPLDFTDEVTWRSGSTDVATIAEDGTLKALATGTTTIKVTVGNQSATCKVTVVQPVTSIWLSESRHSMEALDTLQLTANVSPEDAFDKSITWSSSDDAIAKVDDTGLVTAVAKGEATITATANDGSGVTGSCDVTVTNNAHIASSAEELESEHDYPNDSTDFWQYTDPNGDILFILFDEQTEIEDGFDYLYIYDGSGNEIGKYTGTELAGATVEVRGSTVRIQLVSDNAGAAWGFKVNSIASHIPTPSPVTPTPEIETKAEITELELNDELIDAGFDSKEAVEEKLVETAEETEGFTKENIQIFNVSLLISTNGGQDWQPATGENIPAEGISVTLPYPEGTNSKDYVFVVIHMFVSGANAGKTETLTPAMGEDGLTVTVNSLSPFAVVWKSASNATKGDLTGDGKVNRQDRVYLARALAGWDSYPEPDSTIADLTGDGKVNRQDRVYLARALAGWDGYTV